MTFRIFTLIAIFLLGFQFHGHAVTPVKVKEAEKSAVLKEKGISKSALKEKIEGFTGKKRAKFEKKMNKIKKKIEKKKRKKNARLDGEQDTSGVELGLVIVLVGLLVAILGFAGVADILVSIGIVVLVVGLILWLLKVI